MKKNILYLSKTMGLGGTEKVVLQLCDGLKNEFNKIIVVSSGGIHETWLYKNRIKHYRIDDFDNKNPKVIFKTLIKLFEIIKKENIDIVHSHHRMGTFYCNILRIFKKFSLVHTAHNTFYDKKLFTKLAFKNVKLIAVGNKVSYNLLKFYGVDNVNVIYNGIKKIQYQKKEILKLKELKSKGYFLVGNIGRLSEQKGMEFFIKAIPEIMKKEKSIRFIIVGDGELRDKLENLVKMMELEDYITFLGYRNDVLNVIDQLDLIVLSSLWEGLPLTPIETFMQGKTIVATDVDGTSEIVKDKINGILIRDRNVEDIVNAVLRLYNDEDMRNNMEKMALQTYLDEFTFEKFIEKYKKFYLEIVN